MELGDGIPTLGGRRIGLNFGGKWTDGTGMTENAVFVDGVMTKMHEDVIFTTTMTISCCLGISKRSFPTKST